MIKKCLNCNKDIYVKECLSERKKYCSKQCMNSYRKTITKKICPICKKEFLPSANKVICCSKSCASKLRIKNPKIRDVMLSNIIGRHKTQEEITKIRLRRINEISKNKFNGSQVIPSWNKLSCEFFKQFDENHNTRGQYATNGGEYNIKELGYWLDYINHDLKLIIEWDEKHHYDSNGNLRKKDMERQKQIQEKFIGYKFIRIKEEEYLNEHNVN